MRKLKILASAYACEPDKGSEPGVGWHFIDQISHHHEVWVITRKNNENSLQSGSQFSHPENIHLIYFDLPKWLSFWKKGKRGIRLYYYLWQIGIYFKSRTLYKKYHFDLSHHITFVKYWVPSLLFFLPIPFVWGPVGGGESTPHTLLKSLSIRGKLQEIVREIAKKVSEQDPLLQKCIKKAEVILAATPETKERLQHLGRKKVEILSQVGLSDEDIGKLDKMKFRENLPIRLLSIGNLIPLKGFHLSLFSFKKVLESFSDCEYWLIGDGPEKKKLEKLARKMGLNNKVRFLGELERPRVFETFAETDIFVFPSFHDSGGFVVAEAMAAGKPVVCLNLGGPALQVTEETGFKIPANSPEQVIADMAKAILALANNPGLRKKMGEAGRKRVKKYFLWERKREFLNDVYRDVCKLR